MTDMNFSFLAFSFSQNSLSIGILFIINWLTKFYAICKIIRDVICGFYRLTLASMRNRYVGYIFICCPVKVWAKEVYYVSNCRGITVVYWVRIKTSYDNIYDTVGNLQVYRMTEFRHTLTSLYLLPKICSILVYIFISYWLMFWAREVYDLWICKEITVVYRVIIKIS